MIISTQKRCILACLTFLLIHCSLQTHAFADHENRVSNDMIYDDSLLLTENQPSIFEDCSETAFAFLNNDDDPLIADEESICFIPQFSRWGWTTLLDFSEETGQSSYTMDIYAGAGQCDLSKGTDVGSVTVSLNADNSVTFTYELDGFSLNEAHIYLGTDPYPIGNNESETVAPGQYTFTESDTGAVSDYSVTLPIDVDVFYVIIHGVTSAEDCDEGDCEDSDEDGVCDTEDICPGFDDTIDSDGDGIPDGCDEDECPDSDNDGVCDTDDVCPGFDDTVDTNGNGIPDGCDNIAFEYNSVTAYPIPFKDEVNLKYQFDYDTNVNIAIYDARGIKLTESKHNPYRSGTEGTTKLDLSQISNQLIFVRITTKNEQFTKKLISFN